MGIFTFPILPAISTIALLTHLTMAKLTVVINFGAILNNFKGETLLLATSWQLEQTPHNTTSP